jgi:hypothetical protein
MGLSKAWWRFARGVSLVAAVLLCVGAFLCLLRTELDVFTALTPAHSPALARGADGRYLAGSQEEAEKTAKGPVNADLLTMLLLAIPSFFGLSVGWLLTNTQRQGALCSLGVVGPSLASACEDLSFLGGVPAVRICTLLSHGAQEQA